MLWWFQEQPEPTCSGHRVQPEQGGAGRQLGTQKGTLTPWQTINDKNQQNPMGIFNIYNILMNCTAVTFSLPPHPARGKRLEQSCGYLFVTAAHLDLPAGALDIG